MSFVLYTVTNQIASITLNRAEKRNALSPELVTQLKAAFTTAEQDNQVKVVILKANGESFCAGADLGYLQQLQNFSFEENLADSNHLKELFLKIYTLKKIVIAQVQGHALAGGCGLATVCDFTFSVPEAKFGYTEVRIGFIPALVSVFLIRKIGEQKARHLLLTGDIIQADTARAYGLITEVVPAGELEKRVNQFAQTLITQNSSQSMQLTKQLINEVQNLKLEDALNVAANQNAKARATDDCKKGIASFLNKQEIKW
ncbi:MAG: enoyl-CoA hydratase/isomerase [Bacteroidetes bacterium OLB12]|nr:MAG: enoyl-CoA hydratase/isomerase [Bacteroidetes bacterium OLB12]HNR74389.1 enoyl-CoA hydratase-related protein [Cyclobacteriaceae bacterium]